MSQAWRGIPNLDSRHRKAARARVLFTALTWLGVLRF